MICKYRVTLEGIKGFYRLYTIDAGCSLYRFHKQLRSDLEFPVDQPILFKAFDEQGSVVAKYALIDLGFGAVDEVTVAESIKAGATRFQYFYDTESRKYVIVSLESQEDGSASSISVIESKGPNPVEFENGYVAFEDLPEQRRPVHRVETGEDIDPEDDEDEEDEEGKEENEEEIIYDENER